MISQDTLDEVREALADESTAYFRLMSEEVLRELLGDFVEQVDALLERERTLGWELWSASLAVQRGRADAARLRAPWWRRWRQR